MSALSERGQPAIEAVSVSKAFGGVKAVVDVTFAAHSGEITGLIGPNGAGKSTLLSLLGGAGRPDSGRIKMAGIDITRWPDRRRARAGLIRTFQVSRPLGHMTVLENLLVGAMNTSGETFFSAVFRSSQWKAAESEDLDRALALCERFNLTRVANDFAETLSGGQLRLLELARALMAKPKVLLLDEPFAGVNPTLAQELADHVLTLRDDSLAIVLIEHDLGLMGRLCDPIVVMETGSVLASGSMDELSKNDAVVGAYLGATPAASMSGDGHDHSGS
jgi:ABC-type branched-subunit amino acid transport system ATPase component